MLSPEEVKKYRIQLGLDPTTGAVLPAKTEDVETRIQRLRGATTTPPAAQKEDGILASVAKGLLTPFARTGVNAYNLVTSAGDLATAALEKIGGDDAAYQANLRSANENATKSRRVPFLGELKPVGTQDSFVEGVKDMAGTGAEMASTLIGGGEAGAAMNAGKAGLRTFGKQALSRGLRYGAGSSALYSGGEALVENKDAGDVIKDTAVGGLVGAPLGVAGELLSPVVGGMARRGLRYLKGAPADVVERGATNAAMDAVRAPVPTVGATVPNVPTIPSAPTIPPAAPEIVKGSTIPNALRTTLGGAAKDTVAPLTERTGLTGRMARRVQQVADDSIEKAKLSPLEQEALNIGIDRPDIDFIKSASKEDKKVFDRMISADEGARTNRRINERPASIAGETVINRVKTIEQANKAAGEAVGKAVEAFPNKPIDITEQYKGFVDGLKRNGIAIKNDGTLDFRNSRIAGSTGSKDRELLQMMHDDLRPNTSGQVLRDPRRVYRVRQKFFDELNLAKANDSIGSAEGVLRDTYTELAKPLDAIGDTMNTGYKEARTKFAKTQAALDDFHKLMGTKWAGNLDESAKLRAGEVVQRILGNASASPFKTLGAIDDLLKELGHKDGMSLTDQVIFSDYLEKLFGTTQTRGMRGQVGRGVTDAIPSSMIDFAKKTYQAVKSITPEERRRVLKQLINQK
jgi:hypothetical protein